MTHGPELRGGDRAPRVSRVRLATSPAALLRVGVSEWRPGVLVVSPVGEVDVASAGILRGVARDAVDAAKQCVVVDLGGISFCGSTGMVVLLEISRVAEAAGVRFGTVGGRAIVRRVLEITQLGPTLSHRETLDDLLRELDV
jgi:anti-anti-sigma factor